MRSLAATLLLPASLVLHAQTTRTAPDCARGWPLNMAIAQLKNAGVTSPVLLDESKTTSVRIASEPRPHGLFHQVYRIHLAERSGKTFDLIAVADASTDECSMSDVTTYLIARELPR